MGEKFNLDAVTSDNEPFEFKFGGTDFTLPAEMPIETVSAAGAGDLEGAIRSLLGEEQWTTLVDLEAVLDVPKASALLEAYGEHIGVPMGKSSRSTRPSKRTAVR